jgi:hypothetical protein
MTPNSSAIEQLNTLTQTTDTDSPEILAWMRQEVAIGAEQAERSNFSTFTMAEIKAQVLPDHQRAH